MDLKIKDKNQLVILKEGLSYLSRSTDYQIEVIGELKSGEELNMMLLKRYYIDDLLKKVDILLYGEGC